MIVCSWPVVEIIDQFGPPDDSRPKTVSLSLLGIYNRGRCSSGGRWQFDHEKNAEIFATDLRYARVALCAVPFNAQSLRGGFCSAKKENLK